MSAFIVQHDGIHVQQSIGSLLPLDTIDASFIPEGIHNSTIGFYPLCMFAHLYLHSNGEWSFKAILGKNSLFVKSNGCYLGGWC